MAKKLLASMLLCLYLTNHCAGVEASSFLAEDLPIELSVGYAVRAVDINNDSKLDIAIVESKRVLWLESPSWTVHEIYQTSQAKFDNVCFAPHDVNQDGRIDFALGSDWQPNNTQSGGKIGWLEHRADETWSYHEIAEEPTTHRMRWFRKQSADPVELVVAPLKGKATTGPGFDQRGVNLTSFTPSFSDGKVRWERRLLTNQLPVMHNFREFDLDQDGNMEIITASFDGVSEIGMASNDVKIKKIGSGQEGDAPAKGASEIAIGKQSDNSFYLATIEPWHGDKVVVYMPPIEASEEAMWARQILDDQLAWGHAVSCVNVDADPEEELVVGVRDNQSNEHRCGVRIYDRTSNGDWKRTLIEPGAIAVEDMVTEDLDSDGDADIIAVGRATHNAKIYWNQSVSTKSD